MLYQFRDWESFRYDLWFLKDVGYLRGPDQRPLRRGGYVTYMGTAHTFGRFANRPFPDRLRRRHGYAGLDLSTSAVGPRYFTLKPELIEIANAGRVSVVQATSARSCGNSKFQNDRTGNNVFQAVGSAYDSPFIHETEIFPPMFAQHRIDEVEALVAEMKVKWVEETSALLRALTTPKILLWFSSREPYYEPSRKSWAAMCGEFPQLVNDEMIEEVRPLADIYVDVTTRAGLPVRFRNRFTGAPGQCHFGTVYRGDHGYYPSDEMHAKAADILDPVLARFFTPGERAAVRANPSAHMRMIDLAEQKAREPGDQDPFAPVTLLESLNGFHLSNGVEGRAAGVGKLEPYWAKLVDALAGAAGATGPLRLAVVGRADTNALSAALTGLSERGVVVLLDGGRSDPEQAEVLRQLSEKHGLAIVAFVDRAVVLAPAGVAGALGDWLSGTMRERTVPQFRRVMIQYEGRTYPSFEGRTRSNHAIDHANFK